MNFTVYTMVVQFTVPTEGDGVGIMDDERLVEWGRRIIKRQLPNSHLYDLRLVPAIMEYAVANKEDK